MKNPAVDSARPWGRWLAYTALLTLGTLSFQFPADANTIVEDGTAEEDLSPGIKLRIESCGYDKPRQILVSDGEDCETDDDDSAGDDDDMIDDDDSANGDDDDSAGDDDDSAGDDDDSAIGDDDDSAGDDDDSAGDDDDSAR